MTERGLIESNRAIAPVDIGLQRDPSEVLDNASRAAKALQRVIENKPKKVVINGETYLEFEDWQTVGQFYGYAVRTLDAIPVEINGVRGAKARAELVDVRTGEIVGGAEGYCMNDEDRWGDKPWFQLASMAQTRAGAKAFRNRLAWVVVLAGYKPTPAEEMTGNETPREQQHYCPIHKAAFRKFEKEGRTWYSHKLPDGSYCNESKVIEAEPAPKPTVLQPETAGEQVANAPSQEDHQAAMIKAGLLADITKLLTKKGISTEQMGKIAKRDTGEQSWQRAGIDQLSAWKDMLLKLPDKSQQEEPTEGTWEEEPSHHA